MDSDDFRLWCIIVAMIATVCAVVIGGSWVSGWRDENETRHIENMARLGYEETPVPGSDMKVWRKVQTAPENPLAPVQPVVPEDIMEYITTNTPPNLYDLVSVDETAVNAWTNGLVASIDNLRGEIDLLVRCVERLEGKVENRVRPLDVTCARCGRKHAWSDVLNCYISVVTNRVWEAK